MLTTPPAKKGFHFTSDGIHFAEFIEAETIQEATAIYHKIKRPFPGQSAASPATPETPAEQSTPVEEIKEEAAG
jgi:hypothetical protein